MPKLEIKRLPAILALLVSASLAEPSPHRSQRLEERAGVGQRQTEDGLMNRIQQSGSRQAAAAWLEPAPDPASNMIDEAIKLSAPNKHRSQAEYACGRAVADKKYRDFFLNDQGGYQVSRNKYRPTEIRMPRIIGGDDTTPGEFPWTVSVKLNGEPICGGSLIEPSWILTAAHCVVGYNPKNLTVRLGAYRIKDASETQTVDAAISMFVIHKEYSMPRPFSNDIAMLKLSEPVEFTDFIIPVCLPKEEPAPAAQLEPGSNSIEEGALGKLSGLHGGGQPDEASAASAAIVVSTKMSDLDIAKCFIRIEQNYLNSIGLGPATAAARADDSIKLSKLPISKELLHEIQSVGSGPMQTLALHQGDFSALAHDIAAQVLQAALGAGPEPAAPPPGAPAEREKVSRFLLGQQRAAAKLAQLEEAGRQSAALKGTVVGWGWVRELDRDETASKGYPSVTLQKVKLPILRNSVCEAWFQSQSKKITLLPSQFCAGFNMGGKDACRGDSGGPMIIDEEPSAGKYTLIGIVSAGIGCARPSLPGLYTRVASFLPWIKAQIGRY